MGLCRLPTAERGDIFADTADSTPDCLTLSTKCENIVTLYTIYTSHYTMYLYLVLSFSADTGSYFSPVKRNFA